LKWSKVACHGLRIWSLDTQRDLILQGDLDEEGLVDMASSRPSTNFAWLPSINPKIWTHDQDLNVLLERLLAFQLVSNANEEPFRATSCPQSTFPVRLNPPPLFGWRPLPAIECPQEGRPFLQGPTAFSLFSNGFFLFYAS
jgi:hypothetical protein